MLGSFFMKRHIHILQIIYANCSHTKFPEQCNFKAIDNFLYGYVIFSNLNFSVSVDDIRDKSMSLYCHTRFLFSSSHQR